MPICSVCEQHKEKELFVLRKDRKSFTMKERDEIHLFLNIKNFLFLLNKEELITI